MAQLFTCLKVDHAESVTEITLNRPEKKNALSLTLLKELVSLLDHLPTLNPGARVVILKAEGPDFCSGLDLNDVEDSAKRETMGALLLHVFHALMNTQLVSIVQAKGATFAGGAGLLLAADLSVATPDTRFCFPEVKRGIIPAQVATLLARKKLPMSLAKEWLFLGNTFTAEEAFTQGILNAICASREIDALSTQWSQQILQAAPEALSKTKNLIHHLYAPSIDQDMQHALALFHTSWASQEAQRGLQSFKEKKAR